MTMTADRDTATAIESPRTPRLPPRLIIRTIWALHRTAYRVTGGRLGLRTATDQRAGYLRLRTVGRRTGRERLSVLGYVTDGQNMVTVAMNGWAEAPPAWWLNLQARPEALVDLADGSRPITARVADASERSRVWAKLNGGLWGDLDAFTANRSTETPIVVLEPRT
jgi:deazaflavin-dependent oxidoreductase (nitroreductase family)